MEYGLTASVQKRMKIDKKLPKGQETDYRFCWEVNLTKVQNKNMLLIVHASSRYSIAYANMKPSFWKDIDAEIHTAIADALLREGFSTQEMEEYFRLAGEETLTQTHGRQVMGGVNRITTELPYYRCSFEDGLLQNDFTEALNRSIVKSAVHPEYTCFLPGDYFRNEMSNLIRGQEMKLEFAMIKGGKVIRNGVLEER